MDTNFQDRLTDAIEKAKAARDQASYLSECGQNAGIRKMNSNKCEWLNFVVYLAELGLEAEKLLSESEDLQENEPVCGECLSKDKLIGDLTTINEQLRDQLTVATERAKALQDTYDCEVKYRKELATRAKIDWCNEIIKKAHDSCWLDGSVLVCPVEFLDHCLLEVVKE
jgi:hypothetical protein